MMFLQLLLYAAGLHSASANAVQVYILNNTLRSLEVYSYPKGVTKFEGESICTNLNTTLVSIPNITVQNNLVDFLILLEVTSPIVWTNAIRDTTNSWTWLNSVADSVRDSEWLSADKTVAYLNVPFGNASYHPGSASVNARHYYICQYDGDDEWSCNDRCMNLKDTLSCLFYKAADTSESVCYVWSKKRGECGWYSARNVCLNNSGDLAVFNDTQLMNIPGSLLDKLLMDDDQNIGFWVGLRKNWWIWSSTTLMSADFTYFGGDEPSYDNNICLALTFDDQWSWIETNCAERSSVVLCQQSYNFPLFDNDLDDYLPYQQPLQPQLSPLGPDDSWMLVLTAVLCCFCYPIAIALTVVIVKRILARKRAREDTLQPAVAQADPVVYDSYDYPVGSAHIYARIISAIHSCLGGLFDHDDSRSDIVPNPSSSVAVSEHLYSSVHSTAAHMRSPINTFYSVENSYSRSRESLDEVQLDVNGYLEPTRVQVRTAAESVRSSKSAYYEYVRSAPASQGDVVYRSPDYSCSSTTNAPAVENHPVRPRPKYNVAHALKKLKAESAIKSMSIHQPSVTSEITYPDSSIYINSDLQTANHTQQVPRKIHSYISLCNTNDTESDSSGEEQLSGEDHPSEPIATRERETVYDRNDSPDDVASRSNCVSQTGEDTEHRYSARTSKRYSQFDEQMYF